MKLRMALVVLVTASVAGVSAPIGGDGDWPAFGRDPGAQRFSPLTQITAKNVSALRQAWTFDTGSADLQCAAAGDRRDDVCHGRLHRLRALEPKPAGRSGGSTRAARSAAAAWCTGPEARRAPLLDLRASAMGAMVALDARTGAVVTDFGVAASSI
jgi:quinoprotein glucose dehydrogenase